jgi:hypothetical protein
MSIEELQDVVFSIAGLTPIAVPALVVSAVLCFAFRRSPWITALWTFSACPVAAFFGLIAHLFSNSNGGGPDGGFVGMGTMFALSFSLFEIAAGLLLLCAVPPPRIWAQLPALVAIPGGAASVAGIFFGIHLSTVPPSDQTSAIAFAHHYSLLTDDTLKESFRKRAFVALLKNPQTSPRVLSEAAANLRSTSLYWEYLAHNPALPEVAIDAKIRDRALGPELATRHGLPAQSLLILAKSPDIGTRNGVARNLGTPRDALELLVKDPDNNVRLFAHENLVGTLGEFGY